MKFKHNKKRNTAFLYESLIKECARSLVKREENKTDIISSMIKESFKSDTALGRELKLYRDIGEVKCVDVYTAERLIEETRKEYDNLDKEEIFEKQSALIDSINKQLGKDVFNNFVPNYKNLATIAQIFSKNGVKDRILLERKLISSMVSGKHKGAQKSMTHINGLVYKTFINNFNEKYSKALSERQSVLLAKFVTSFSDNGLALKAYLNEEVPKLKSEIISLKEKNEIKSDGSMVKKADEVLELLESFKKVRIDRSLITKILKIQQLIEEAHS
jgi:hypothetical protein